MSQWALFKLGMSRLQQVIRDFIFYQTSLRRLAVLLVISVLLSSWGANRNVTAGMLFQSPQSPPPPVEADQPAEPPPAEPPPAEQAPVEQPQEEQPPAEPPPAEQAPAEQPPDEQPPVEQAPAEPVPVEQPAADQSAAEIASPESSLGEEPADEAAVPDNPPAEPVRVERRSRDEGQTVTEQETNNQNLILDRAEFIDTAVVSGAYIWLCCGVIAFLLVPVFMLILYVRGRSKIVSDEDS